MATYVKGIFGSLSGSIGNVTTTKWKKLNVVKNKPGKYKGNPSKAQQASRLKFGLVNSFLGRINKVIAVGYRPRKGKYIPINLATRALMANGVTGNYPDYKLDYPNISLTRTYAQIDFTLTPAIAVKTGNQLKISWALNPCADINTKLKDIAYIVLYSENIQRHIIYAGKQRSALSLERTLPLMFSGEKVHCWMFFASADQKMVSPTDYLGEVTLI